MMIAGDEADHGEIMLNVMVSAQERNAKYECCIKIAF